MAPGVRDEHVGTRPATCWWWAPVLGHVDGGDRGIRGPEGAGGGEGSALRRHHRALGRLAVGPGHPPGHRAGHHRTAGAARTYLQHEATTHFDAARVDAFLEQGPQGHRLLHPQDLRAVRHAAGLSPTTTPKRRAASPGGRSMVTRPFDGRELGPRVKQLAPPLPELTVFGMMLGSGKEIWHFMRAFKSLESFVYVAKRLSLHALDVLRFGRGMTLTNGNALAGRLAKAAMDLKVPVWLSSPVKELITEHGAVLGAWSNAKASPARARPPRRGAGLRRLPARRGAAQAALSARAHRGRALHAVARSQYRRRPAPGRSRGRPRRPTIPHAAAWVPTSVTQAARRQRRRDAALHRPRQAGCHRRHRAGQALHQRRQFVPRLRAGPGGACKGQKEVSCWLLCDHRTLRQYGLGCVAPFPMPLWPPPAHRLPQAWRNAGRSGACHRR
jgi:hypothetical protein